MFLNFRPSWPSEVAEHYNYHETKNVLSKIGEINIKRAIYLQWYTTQNGLRNQPKQLELHKDTLECSKI